MIERPDHRTHPDMGTRRARRLAAEPPRPSGTPPLGLESVPVSSSERLPREEVNRLDGFVMKVCRVVHSHGRSLLSAAGSQAMTLLGVVRAERIALVSI